MWREFSSKNTNKLLERKEREKRRRERRERKKSEQFFEKEERKKKMKKLALATLFSVKFLSKIKEKEVLFYRQTVVKLFHQSIHNALYFLSSFFVPRTTNTSYDTKQAHEKNMTDSKRSNAAGEKYALRGIYGSEPYWPQEKLKICVTGAGGFIGET